MVHFLHDVLKRASQGRLRRLKHIVISLRRAGIARPLALPMGELARLKAVTERVPGCNHDTFSIFATANTLSGSLFARQLPHRGSQGRLRRRICTVLPAAPGGQR